MKIKSITLLIFLLISPYLLAAKYGKTDPDKLYSRAIKFIDQERFFEAKKVLKAYTKSKPEDSYGWTLRALILCSERKLGGLEKAEQLYEKALTLDSNNKAALEYQGELFAQTNRPLLAESNLAKLKILCPDSCEEVEQLGSYIKGIAEK